MPSWREDSIKQMMAEEDAKVLAKINEPIKPAAGVPKDNGLLPTISMFDYKHSEGAQEAMNDFTARLTGEKQ